MMIPLKYNVRNLRVRWKTTLMTVLGTALLVASSCILFGLVEGLDEQGPWRLLLLPDHATPLRLKTHTSDPVPYLLVDS